MTPRHLLQRLALVSGLAAVLGVSTHLSPAAELVRDPAERQGREHGNRLLRVSLSDTQAWKALAYEGRTQHSLEFSADGLMISVRESAMPLFHRLAKPVQVRGLRASGTLEGAVRTTAAKQGTKGHDDYALRIGLVLSGPAKLSWWERRRAPGWIKELFARAPQGSGISEVRFLNLGIASSTVGKTRRHPSSQILHEEVVSAPAMNGEFSLRKVFEQPVEVCAVWISADGDDTKSSFDVRLRELILEMADIK